MKTVLYVLTSLSHKRVFETFVERSDIHQVVAGPWPTANSPDKIVPEDYSDFKLKNIKYFKHPAEIQMIIDKVKPDIFVQASLPVAQGLILPKGCKKVYVSHGMIGNHVKGIIKPAGFNTSVWKGADLYCGASPIFADWIKHVAKVGDDKILLNAIPQLDILHDPNYYESYRDRVLAQTKFPEAKKVLLFVGFCCKDRYDFYDHNEDYFRTVIELEKIARKEGWLVMVKPRQTYAKMMEFLRTHKWGKKYLKPYAEVQASKHLHFITTTGHIYRYLFADAIICNGTSTVEFEACAANKQLVIVRTEKNLCDPNVFDPMGTVGGLACIVVGNMFNLEAAVWDALRGDYSQGREQVIQNFQLTLDGKMHERVQDKLVRL